MNPKLVKKKRQGEKEWGKELGQFFCSSILVLTALTTMGKCNVTGT